MRQGHTLVNENGRDWLFSERSSKQALYLSVRHFAI